jgi:hypothetical protein
MPKSQQPKNTRALDASLKLHLRLLRIRGETYRLLTLRPGTGAAFSTNFFHETWHVVTDLHGARLLARLLWTLAYQRLPRTLVALHGEHLRPTPFEAERSLPVLLVPSHLTPLNADDLRVLKERLPHLGPSQGTVRCLTFGMDQEVQREVPGNGKRFAEYRNPVHRQAWQAEQMRLCGGWICYSAPPSVLRTQALSLNGMRFAPDGIDYHYLAEPENYHPGDGEVQIFRDYFRQLSVAEEARREVLAESPPAEITALRERIWSRCGEIQQRRMP